MMMNCFCGMVDLRTAGSRIFRRDHRYYPTCRGGKRSRIAEIAIRSATTTPRRQNLLSQIFQFVELKGNEVFCISTINFLLP